MIDGDNEGYVRIDHLPNADEAKGIRAAIELKHRPPLTAAQIEQLRVARQTGTPFEKGKSMRSNRPEAPKDQLGPETE